MAEAVEACIRFLAQTECQCWYYLQLQRFGKIYIAVCKIMGPKSCGCLINVYTTGMWVRILALPH